jgi:hypothetical protein
LREAIERLPQPATNWTSIADAIKVLVGRGDLQPALPAAGDADRATSARPFNCAILARVFESAEFGYLASPATGGAVRVDRLAQLYPLARRRGGADPAEMLARIGAAATGVDGAPLLTEEARNFAQKEAARIETNVLPMIKKLGID